MFASTLLRMTVTLRAMTASEFNAWSAASIESYTEDIAAAGSVPSEDARAQAEKQWHELLPNGQHTRDSWFLKVVDGERTIGSLWIGPHRQRPDAAFIYDIVIDESEQGRGFGRQAMLAAEDLVREAGLVRIGLNVFGFNERAKRLYDSLGYAVVATVMTKALD